MSKSNNKNQDRVEFAKNKRPELFEKLFGTKNDDDDGGDVPQKEFTYSKPNEEPKKKKRRELLELVEDSLEKDDEGFSL